MSAFAQVDAALAAIQGSTAQPGASAELLKRLITLTRSVNTFPNEDTGASVEHLAGFPGWQDASTGVQQFLHTWLSAAVGSTQADTVQQQLQREPGNWDAWEGVTDVLDVLLEQADTQLSIAAGNDPRAQQAAMAERAAASSAGTIAEAAARAARAKPQTAWARDNTRLPWRPMLPAGKRHALAAPAKSSYGPDEHPYQAELQLLRTRANWPAWMLEPATEREWLNLDDTPCAYVDTDEAWDEVMQDLRAPHVKELAIDLEAHSQHSFPGITCLLQMSTRDKDYLVDVLALRHRIEELNEITCDPQVLKVLHGARSDVGWLQRDFNVYLVGMFDTGLAARALRTPSAGLAHLLQVYAQVETDKALQTADWRARPLPDVMLRYARMDTHYLLGIADRMRNELLDSSTHGSELLFTVLQQAIDLCGQLWSKPTFEPRGWQAAIQAVGVPSPKGSDWLLWDALWEWRDRAARLEDESCNAVCPVLVLSMLVHHKPTTPSALRATAKLLPAVVSARAAEVCAVIQQAAAGRYTAPADTLVKDAVWAAGQSSPATALAPLATGTLAAASQSAGARTASAKALEDALASIPFMSPVTAAFTVPSERYVAPVPGTTSPAMPKNLVNFFRAAGWTEGSAGAPPAAPGAWVVADPGQALGTVPSTGTSNAKAASAVKSGIDSVRMSDILPNTGVRRSAAFEESSAPAAPVAGAAEPVHRDGAGQIVPESLAAMAESVDRERAELERQFAVSLPKSLVELYRDTGAKHRASEPAAELPELSASAVAQEGSPVEDMDDSFYDTVQAALHAPADAAAAAGAAPLGSSVSVGGAQMPVVNMAAAHIASRGDATRAAASRGGSGATFAGGKRGRRGRGGGNSGKSSRGRRR